MPLAKVDCTSEAGGKEICSEFGVQGYPTLKIFKGGEFAQEYNGPREADGIVKYMKSQVGPASRSYTSVLELGKRLKDATDVLVLGVFNAESDALFRTFSKTADKLRESVDFVHILLDSAAGDSLSSLQGVPTLHPPTVVLVRPPALSNKFEPGHVVYSDSDGDLTSWVKEKYHGLVGIRTQDNMEGFKTPLVTVYFDVDYTKNPKGTNYWRNRVLKVAKEFSKVRFAVSSATGFAGEIDEFGLSVPTGKDASPVVGAKDADGKKYVMNEKFSVDSLHSFVENFLEGRLSPHVKSEELPEDNSGPVKVAVGKNFDELVTKTEKDTLIEFCE